MIHRHGMCGVLVVFALASSAHASLLNLNLLPSPDITSGFIDVSYDTGSNAFVASGFALTLYDGDQTHNIANGLFDLNATIDSSGNALGGSLSISGSVDGFDPPLLTGQLTDFGFQPGGGDLFEFLFTVTGGDLAIPGYYGTAGSIFGVILNANGSGFTGDWNLSFDNFGGQPGSGQGISDAAPVPAPAALATLLIGFIAGARRRRV